MKRPPRRMIIKKRFTRRGIGEGVKASELRKSTGRSSAGQSRKEKSCYPAERHPQKERALTCNCLKNRGEKENRPQTLRKKLELRRGQKGNGARPEQRSPNEAEAHLSASVPKRRKKKVKTKERNEVPSGNQLYGHNKTRNSTKANYQG